MRDLSRASVEVDTFNNSFPKAPHACCFLYCYRDHIRSPLDVANGIIISPLADRFLMNASVCATSMLLILYAPPIMITSERDLWIEQHNCAVLIDNKINAAKCSAACA